MTSVISELQFGNPAVLVMNCWECAILDHLELHIVLAACKSTRQLNGINTVNLHIVKCKLLHKLMLLDGFCRC